MTLDLFSSIRSSGSSVSAPAEGDESEVRAESRGLGWDDSSVISETTEEEIDLAPEKNCNPQYLILQPHPLTEELSHLKCQF